MTYPSQQPYSSGYPEASQSTLILVLGILGLVICQVLSPIAWFLGNQELTGIDTGRRDPAGRSTANAGRILGIIGTVLLIIGVIVLIFFLVALVALSGSVSDDFEQISENVLGLFAAH
jgi:uncharacterized membrane protein YjgN (DUF898 family)